MNHDALDASMFWVGALFAFTPVVLGGAVLLVWWWKLRAERKERAEDSARMLLDREAPGAPSRTPS
jgi:cbb3-type cytochrome oxidase subunit 3